MTAQIHERLISNGVETSMTFCPPLPKGSSRVAERDPNGSAQDWIHESTACWRRYQGTWEIRENRFYLAGLAGRFEFLGSDPLFAEWFTGALRVPKGEQLVYVHMGFGSVYEEEVHIKVERGIVVGTRVIDNRGKKLDPEFLGWMNLPGFENRFEGDDHPDTWLGKLLRRVFE